jgi:hypothetical protein
MYIHPLSKCDSSFGKIRRAISLSGSVKRSAKMCMTRFQTVFRLPLYNDGRYGRSQDRQKFDSL